jgi:SAM-dependent methyltransferase
MSRKKSTSHERIWVKKGDKAPNATANFSVNEVVPSLRRARGKQKNYRVLDIGCGPGITTERLARDGFDVFATDISPEAIKQCRKRLTKYFQIKDARSRVILHDMRKPFPFPGQHFDAIISISVLHHNTPRQLDACLKHINRMLKKSGRLIVGIVNEDFISDMRVIDKGFGPLYLSKGNDIWARKGQLYYPVYDNMDGLKKGVYTMERIVSARQPKRFIPVYHMLFNRKSIHRIFGRYFMIRQIKLLKAIKGVLFLVEMEKP